MHSLFKKTVTVHGHSERRQLLSSRVERCGIERDGKGNVVEWLRFLHSLRSVEITVSRGWLQKTVFVLLFIFLVPANSGADEGHHDQKDEWQPTSKIVQEFCPVKTEELIDPDIYTEYEGQRVYFCCNMCRRKFLANPTEYLEALPQFAGRVVENHDDHEAGHDHATGHGQPEGLGRVIRFLGKFHPMVVHFPIALIMVAALAEALLYVTQNKFFNLAARFCLAVGALSVLVVVPLGWAAWTFATYSGRLADTLSDHRWLGTSSGIIILIVFVLSEWSSRRESQRIRVAYRLFLALAVILISVTAHFGAMLIFGWEYFTW